MRQYVQYVADLLLQRLGVGLLYGESNPVRVCRVVMDFLCHSLLSVVSFHGVYGDT